MQVADCTDNLPHENFGERLWHKTTFPHVLEQVAARTQLHKHQVVRNFSVLRLQGLVDLDDVWVPNALKKRDFVEELRQSLLSTLAQVCIVD